MLSQHALLSLVLTFRVSLSAFVRVRKFKLLLYGCKILTQYTNQVSIFYATLNFHLTFQRMIWHLLASGKHIGDILQRSFVLFHTIC